MNGLIFKQGCCHNTYTASSACLFSGWAGQVASSLLSALIAHIICILIISILIKLTTNCNTLLACTVVRCQQYSGRLYPGDLQMIHNSRYREVLCETIKARLLDLVLVVGLNRLT